MDPSDKGSLMLQFEQDIPNPAKLRAKKEYIASQGNVENANRAITMNDYKAQAKLLYYGWLVALQRTKVLGETERIMTTMKKIEEIRYPYNQSQLGSVFRADARIEENRNMVSMYEGEIAKARAWLNSLMNERGDNQFTIDTNYHPVFIPQATYDTAILSTQRKDIFKMDESIRSMQLNIKSMSLEKKPAFRVRFDHMYPLDAMMPNAFSVMGMISIPIAPWSSKMYKNETKAMQLNVEAMRKERSAMLNETQGMLYGMQYEIQSMQQRIRNMEGKIIPALQRAFDADFQTYQENKLSITTVIADWEALSMMKMSVLDEQSKLYQMIVSYEKELYK
jgi:outer membrane protein, heavy metal efflux system